MKDITIINKMIKELHIAKEKTNDREELLTHIGHVKLLCELFLEDDAAATPVVAKETSSEITEQEIKAMLGEKQQQPSAKTEQTSIEYDEANGDSIFDF